MSAVVIHAGRACKVMEVGFLPRAPHLHMHFFTTDEDHRKLGYGKMEACCHGCHRSLLIYFTADHQSHVQVVKKFEEKHLKCPGSGYCHDHREHVETVDLREKEVLDAVR